MMLRWMLVLALASVSVSPALAVDESDLADLIERGETDAARALIDELSPSTDSVKEVAGEVLILDDGAVYKVWPSYERLTVSAWKYDDVFVTSDGKMVNTDSMEVVDVRRVD